MVHMLFWVSRDGFFFLESHRRMLRAVFIYQSGFSDVVMLSH